MRSLGSNGQLGLTALLFIGLGLTACGGESATSSPANSANGAATTSVTAADDAAIASDLTAYHAHHHGGLTHLVIMSVETIGGTPDQHDKIEKVRAELLAKTEPVHDANKALLGALADVLADGTASPEETAKVDAAVANVATASSAAQAASADALNELHGILDATQRAVLVQKVEANWQVWREANAAEDKDNNGIPDAEEGRLARLTNVLTLTPDEITKIKSSLKSGMATTNQKLDPAEVDAQIKAFSDAFMKDAFDAKSLHAEGVDAHIAGAGAARMARFYIVLAPVLTPDQRTKLVDNFHKHQNESRNLPNSGT